MSEPYLGQIIMFGGNFPIRGFAFCEGQTLQIAQNQALFSILGTTYGGDGRTNFKLPDMRGRIPLQQGQGPGLPNYPLGQSSGSYQKQLTLNELPAHNHSVQTPCNSEGSTSDDPDGKSPGVGNENIYAANTDGAMKAFNSSQTGGGAAFSIQNPYLAINFLIALTGLFPSRN